MRKLKLLAGAALLAASAASTAHADQVINDDLIVTFSACIGNDCVNGENFGFDTLRLKENNLRIHFNDTSNSASFPTNDWRIVANDTSNGGANYLAFEDSDAGTRPFQVDAGAGNNALRVESGGNVGFGTSNPAVNLHVVEGNTPTLRLEQDGSSGFTPQVYDIAANEANFFIRDVTNGSALFFRAQPGAPADSIYIASDGDVGMGTSSPASAMHVQRSNGTAAMVIRDTGTSNGFINMLELDNATDAGTGIRLSSGANEIDFSNFQNEFRVQIRDGDPFEMALDAAGNLTVTGTVTATGGATLPDYVFEEGYALRSLDELREFIAQEGHLPGVVSAREARTEDGRYSIEMISFQFALLEKIEELTLYTLAQEDAIRELQADLDASQDG